MSQKVNSKEPHVIDDAICLDVNVTCENFELEVNEVLDRRQSPGADPRLAEHAAECAACHEIFRDYLLVDDSLKLCRGDIQRILAEKSRQPIRSVRYHVIGILSSVALLLLMGLILIPQPDGRYQDSLAMNDASAVLETVARDVELANRASVESETGRLVSKPTEAFSPESTRKLVNLLGIPLRQGIEFPPAYFAESQTQLTTLGSEFGNQIHNALAAYTSDLKVVGPVGGSVGLTLEILRTLSNRSFSKEREQTIDPDLGRFLAEDSMFVSV